MSRWHVPEHFKVLVGGNTYIDCPTIIDYKGQSIFELRRSDSDGFLGISFEIYDSHRDRVATVRNGQFVGAAPSGYLLEETRDHFLLVETASGRRVCELRLREKVPGDAEIEVEASMYMPDGKLIAFTHTSTHVAGSVITGCTFEACGPAIEVT